MKNRKLILLIFMPIVIMCFFSVGFSDADITSNLMAYWDCDENTGTVLNDSSVYGNNGLITSPSWVAGKYGYGLNFDGSGTSYVTVPDDVTLKIVGNMTFSAWVNMTNITGNQVLLFKGAGVEYYIYFSDSYITLNDNSGDYSSWSEYAFSTLNSWKHIVVTRDETANLIIYYVDGVQVANDTYNGIGTTSTNDLIIGKSSWANFNGTLDEIKLFNRVLTPSEVSDLYDYDPTAPTPTPFVSATPFPEGDMSNTDWWISILVLLLIIINIFLMMLPFALVRFTFGILSLFLCMLALTYQIPLSPYLQTAGLLISALAMLFSVRARE